MVRNYAFKPIELKQSDVQGCLHTALLMLRAGYTREKLNYYYELVQLFHSSYGLYSHTNSYLLARTAAFARRFSDSILEISVSNLPLKCSLEQINKENNIIFLYRNITIETLIQQLKGEPLIILLDSLHLDPTVAPDAIGHDTHYILAFQEGKRLAIIDPVRGYKEDFSDQIVENGIMGLKYQMLWSPVTIGMRVQKIKI